MVLTWNEVELTDTVYNPSLRLRFFRFLSRSIPKAKEWKLTQRTWPLLRFYFPEEEFNLPSFPILDCSLFGSSTGIRANSKALVRVCQPGPKPFKVKRQITANVVKPSVLHSGHTSQRLINPSYQHHVVIFVAVVISYIISYPDSLLCWSCIGKGRSPVYWSIWDVCHRRASMICIHQCLQE